MSGIRPGGRILIIDDEEDFARTLASRLVLRGMTARCAFDGDQGLALLENGPADLLLLDMRMPGLSGVDVLRRLRSGQAAPGNEALPVFIVSGYASEGDFQDAEALGIQGFFTKPLQFDDLLAAIARILPDTPVRTEDAP